MRSSVPCSTAIRASPLDIRVETTPVPLDCQVEAAPVKDVARRPSSAPPVDVVDTAAFGHQNTVLGHADPDVTNTVALPDHLGLDPQLAARRRRLQVVDP